MSCWHAETDGWAVTTFHRQCDGKGPTVTIIKVSNYIFGGYTDVSWSGPSKYHSLERENRKVYKLTVIERVVLFSSLTYFVKTLV